MVQTFTLTREQILFALAQGSVNIATPEPITLKFNDSEPPKDPRPAGWEGNYSYQFPSQRDFRQIGHQVTRGKVSDQKAGVRETFCDCKASRFGNKCWAREAVEKNTVGFAAPPSIYSWRGSGKRIAPYAQGKEFGNRQNVE